MESCMLSYALRHNKHGCYVPLPPLFLGMPPTSWAVPLMGVTQQGQYRYMPHLQQLEACKPARSIRSWPRCPSPIHVECLTFHLRAHPDREFVSYILQGLTQGFRIGYSYHGARPRPSQGNLPSSLANPAAITAHLETEGNKGRVVGPVQGDSSSIQVSPLGLVPKGHRTDQWRVIVHLSAPRNFSVNDGISKECCSLSYASLDDAVSLICQLGPRTQLVKMDLKDAYRIIPVHPDDHHLLGMKWNTAVFVDCALPFGLRSAPKIFTAFADAVAWALHAAGIRFLLHYLDDFLFLGSPGTPEALQAAQTAEALFARLGIPIAHHKTEGPATRITFLGIHIDTESGMLSLPQEKLQRIRELVQTWQRQRRHTRKDLESLLGHLSHAATVIRPGRIFLRSLFALLPAAPLPHHHVRLNAVARADLRWWEHFLHLWNGTSLFPPCGTTIDVYSDASGSFGCGAFCSQFGAFQVQWPPSWSTTDISVKELVPLIIAAALWAPSWTGHRICFHVDNMAVVAIIQKQRARDNSLTHFLRCLSFYASYFRFEFSAEHIPGSLNTAADAISRNHLTHFVSLVPQVPLVAVPPLLLELFLHQPLNWTCPQWIAMFRASLLRDFHQPHGHPT